VSAGATKKRLVVTPARWWDGGMSKDSLFARAGGEAGIEKLVEAFYERVLADEVLAPFFEHAPMDHLRTMQKELFSEALGGPLYYSGRSLRQVHAGKGIKRRHVRRFVGHLLKTLEAEREDLKITEQEVKDIYSRIAVEVDRVTDDVTESG
jgi:hemoglobin